MVDLLPSTLGAPTTLPATLGAIETELGKSETVVGAVEGGLVPKPDEFLVPIRLGPEPDEMTLFGPEVLSVPKCGLGDESEPCERLPAFGV